MVIFKIKSSIFHFIVNQKLDNHFLEKGITTHAD